MPELIAKTALQGHRPLTLAGTTLAEADPGPVHSVALFPGQEKAAAKALKPLAFPAPNRFTEAGASRLVWTGRDQAFLIGAEPPALEGIAAVTDQSGGWATLTLTGPLGRRCADAPGAAGPAALRSLRRAMPPARRSGICNR